MTRLRTPILQRLAIVFAVPILACSLYGQTKVLINAFDSAAEVTASGKNWNNWFGLAYYQAMWDSSDASNNVNSGSLQLQAFYPDSGIGGCCGPQFVLYNQNNGISPSLIGNGGNPSSALATNVEFDVRFSNVPPEPNHSIWAVTNAGVSTNWPTIEVGTRGTDFGQHTFGTFNLPVSNTNWNHISIPIPANAIWTNIPNVFFKHFSSAAAGWVVMYVDNIVFTTAAIPIIPPTVTIDKAHRAVRMVAGPSQFDRTQLLAVDTNQSWVGGTYPVTYSFKIGSFDINPPINEFHVFLTPINYIQGGVLNAFTDFSSASNNLRLIIVGGAAGTPTVSGAIAWKTNLINSNPDHLVANITNATFAGTWTIRFTSATDGTLITPSGSSTNFSLPSDVAATFANPLAYFIGIQPDPTTAIGEYADLEKVENTGVASPGASISTDFTTATSIDTNVWTTASVTTAVMLLVTNSTSWWINNSYPDYGAVVATEPALSGSVPWKTAAFYTGYDTNLFNRTIGIRSYHLVPAEGLPTVDGTSNGVKSAGAVFRLQTPAPAE